MNAGLFVIIIALLLAKSATKFSLLLLFPPSLSSFLNQNFFSIYSTHTYTQTHIYLYIDLLYIYIYIKQSSRRVTVVVCRYVTSQLTLTYLLLSPLFFYLILSICVCVCVCVLCCVIQWISRPVHFSRLFPFPLSSCHKSKNQPNKKKNSRKKSRDSFPNETFQ